jgi:hypothetical protein
MGVSHLLHIPPSPAAWSVFTGVKLVYPWGRHLNPRHQWVLRGNSGPASERRFETAALNQLFSARLRISSRVISRPRSSSLSDLGPSAATGGTPVHIGASARCIVPLCASHSRQSGLGLPWAAHSMLRPRPWVTILVTRATLASRPSRDDVPKPDRLLAGAIHAHL